MVHQLSVCKLLMATLTVLHCQVISISLFPSGPPADRSLMLNPPVTILRKQWSCLDVNDSGMISFTLEDTSLQLFPLSSEGDQLIVNSSNEVSINNDTSAEVVTEILNTSLQHSFDPTTVLVITWHNLSIPLAKNSSITNVTALQCILAFNETDTFIFYLYEDGFTGYGVRIEMHGSGYTNFSLDTSCMSNVDEPGLWILKVDDNIIGGHPMSPTAVEVTSIGSTELTLEWMHATTINAAESFMISCTDLSTNLNTSVYYPNSTGLGIGMTTNFSIMVENLEEYTNYTCFVVARNLFGMGPVSSKTPPVITNSAAPSSPPEDITVVAVSVNSFQLEWGPPSEEDRNGVITGYRILLEWGTGEHRVHTTDTHYTFTDLQQGTTYYYSIAAETSADTGPFSNRTSVTTIIPEQPPPVLGFYEIIGIAAGAAVLLLLFIACIAILCITHMCKRKTRYTQEKEEVTTHTAKDQDDKQDKVIDMAVSVRTTAANDYTTSDQHHKPKTCTESDKKLPTATTPENARDAEANQCRNTQPNQHLELKIMSSDEGSKKKPLLPPSKPPKVLPKPKSRKKKQQQQNSSETVYMSLSNSTRKGAPMSEYMPLSDATRQQSGSKSATRKITGNVSRDRLEGATEVPGYVNLAQNRHK